MKKSLLIILSAVSIISASQSGAEIFKKCGICHGNKGQKHSLNITKYIAAIDKNTLVDILKKYRSKERDKYGLGSVMQGQASKLTDGEINAVSAYISTLPPVKVDKNVAKKVSKEVHDGAEIFKKCAICHGDRGNKHSLGVSKYIAGMDKDHIYETLKKYRTGKLSSYGYGSMMKGQATKLSDKQMKAVAAYVSLLPAVEPIKKEQRVKITKEQVDRNTFVRDFFANSKDPNETLKNANKAYDEYIKKQKEKNE